MEPEEELQQVARDAELARKWLELARQCEAWPEFDALFACSHDGCIASVTNRSIQDDVATEVCEVGHQVTRSISHDESAQIFAGDIVLRGSINDEIEARWPEIWREFEDEEL